MAIKRTLQQWSVEDSTELYGIRNWGAGYFGVSPEGDVVIYPSGENKGVAVSVPEVIRGMRERGYDMPVLLRIENILDSQITLLHESFRKAIASLGYKGEYRGVFPIKVTSSSIRSRRSPSSARAFTTASKSVPKPNSFPPFPSSKTRKPASSATATRTRSSSTSASPPYVWGSSAFSSWKCPASWS